MRDFISLPNTDSRRGDGDYRRKEEERKENGKRKEGEKWNFSSGEEGITIHGTIYEQGINIPFSLVGTRI